MKTLLLVSILFCTVYGQAQTTLAGNVTDSSRAPLQAAVVKLISDSSRSTLQETITDSTGNFIFTGVNSGRYNITVSFVGFGTLSYPLSLTSAQSSLTLPPFRLAKATGDLAGVTVTATVPGVTQKGDTVQYNASQYKVNPDATSEDLIKKMPGVTVGADGTVTAHGDQVRKVLVDGKEYFGDDATATLRNMPAEIVEKIQVFDKLSDQAQFTGFDDGNSQRTINIVTKGGTNGSQFGKVYAGYGTDGRYTAGGSVNFFNGDRRIALIGLTNNINQQNFSQQDILGVMSGGNSGRGGRGGFGGGQNNFFTGTSNGINTTHSVGINYSDKWSENLSVTGSYFFNNSRNTTGSNTNREYLVSADSSVFYTEKQNSTNNNYNHRFNLRMEYKIDSANQLIFTPSVSFQNNRSNSILASANSLASGKILTDIINSTNTFSSGYNASANLVYRHAFAKRGRSLTLGVTPSLSDNTGETYQDVYDNQTGNDSLRYRDRNSHTKSISGNIAFTEPVGKQARIQINYSPTFQNSTSKQLRYDFDGLEEKYSELDTSLSNLFNNDIVKQNAGINYRIGDRNNNFMVGVSYQYTHMNSAQTYPQALTINKAFNNVLPNLMFNKKLSAKTSVRLFYRAATQTPSVTQLQNVYNDNNVLFVTTGNPNLKQSYNNSIAARLTFTNTAKSTSFFVNAFAQQNNSYITNATYTASKDSALTQTLVLKQGAQLSMPVNLDGYKSYRTLATFSFPLKAIKTTINVNGGFNYTKQPGLINYQSNFSKNYQYNSGIVLASNINEYVDFTIGYNPSYTVVKNTLQPSLNNNYYSGTATASINLLSKSGWVIHTDLNNQTYSGLSGGFNQSFTLWNASAGKKFLKNQRGDLRLSVFDLLKQNQSIQRNVTESYIEDVQTNVLQRYFMLTFTYKINHVRTGSAAKQPDEERVPRSPVGERNFRENRPPRVGGGEPGGPSM